MGDVYVLCDSLRACACVCVFFSEFVSLTRKCYFFSQIKPVCVCAYAGSVQHLI